MDVALALRYDIGTLRPPRRTADGRLRVDGALTRSGVFVYRDGSGKERREYRAPDEVFAAHSLETFAAVPVTLDHPPVPVTAANAREYAVGLTGENVRRDGDHAVASLTVFDAAAVAAIEAGKRELSCGYEVDLVHESGVTPDGEHFDARQTNIRGNHVAIVDTGRAGPSAAIRMDSEDVAAMVPRADNAIEGYPSETNSAETAAEPADDDVPVTRGEMRTALERMASSFHAILMPLLDVKRNSP